MSCYSQQNHTSPILISQLRAKNLYSSYSSAGSSSIPMNMTNIEGNIDIERLYPDEDETEVGNYAKKENIY